MGDKTLNVVTDDLAAQSTANKNAFAGDGDQAASTAASIQSAIGEEALKGYLGEAYVEEAKNDQKAYAAINEIGGQHAQVGENAADGLDEAAERTVASFR